MDLLYELMDQNILDCRGDRAGRVDDVVVEDVFDRPAKVLALLSGGGTMARQLWAPYAELAVNSLPSPRLPIGGPIKKQNMKKFP